MARKFKVGEDDELLDDEIEDEDVPEDEIEELIAENRGVGIGLFTAGLLLGAVIGAGAVYLTAPAPAPAPVRGSRVKRRFRDFRDDARGHIDHWRDEARRSLARQRRRIRRRRRKRE